MSEFGGSLQSTIQFAKRMVQQAERGGDKMVQVIVGQRVSFLVQVWPVRCHMPWCRAGLLPETSVDSPPFTEIEVCSGPAKVLH